MMKNAKKMIMVPEMEYNVLMSMLNTANPLSLEKALLEDKMHQVLASKKLDENVKMKKYNLLTKQYKQLSQQISDKPQKVIVENIGALTQTSPPSVAPYFGINPIPTKSSTEPNVFEYDAIENEEEKMKKKYKERPITDIRVPVKKQNIPHVTQHERRKQKLQLEKGFEFPFHIGPFINKNFVEPLADYVDSNREKFGILDDDSVRVTRNRSQGDYKNIIDYMSRKEQHKPPPAFMFLFEKLKNDPYFQDIYNKSYQQGFGGRRKIVKVRRLKRIKINQTFKPQLWARL